MKTVLGAVTVTVCCFILGRKATEKDAASVKQLDTVIKLLYHIKEGICSALMPLPEIYASFACNEGGCDGFVDALKAHGLSKALDKTSLPPDAYGPLNDLLETLGRLDGESQCERLNSALETLIRIRDSEQQELERKSKSVQALFSLAGAIAVILML